MTWIALKMLTGDRAKYLGIIAGVTFAALLIAQQASIGCGLLLRTTSTIQDVADVDIWVMDRDVEFIDELKALTDDDLYRVRGVPGVDWAVPFYKGQGRVKLDAGKPKGKGVGLYQQVIVLGLDDDTLVGAPRRMVLGKLADLRIPDAVVMDESGYKYLWPKEPLRTGRVFEMNDHRAVIVGICKASETFQTFPILYTRYHQALQFIPQPRQVMSAVLVHPKPGVDVHVRLPAHRGADADPCGLAGRGPAAPQGADARRVHVADIGLLHAPHRHHGQLLDHRRPRLRRRLRHRRPDVLLVHAGKSEPIRLAQGDGREQPAHRRHGAGPGGRGGADRLLPRRRAGGAVRRDRAALSNNLAFYMPWQVPVGTAAAVAFIALLSSLLSVRKVLFLEPAVVFRG